MCTLARIGSNSAAGATTLPSQRLCWEYVGRAYRDEPSRQDSHSDIAKAIGPAAWQRLTDDIRRRFSHGGSHAQHHVYKGTMITVESSWAGYLLAHLCRLIGTPLAPFTGRNVPVTVQVGHDHERHGTEWLREYVFAGDRQVSVRSAKVLDADNRLLEFVGGGFGMELNVFEEDHALHFVSTRYFWEKFGVRLYLPHLFSPGTTHVVHTDVGDGRFRFTITITHALLGRMFFQDGIFAEKGDV